MASTTADARDVTSILLLRCFSGETALLKLRVEMHGPPVGPRFQFGILRQAGQGFENGHHRLGRFKAARIEFDDLGFWARVGRGRLTSYPINRHALE